MHRPCLDCGRRQQHGSRCEQCDTARQRQQSRQRGTREQRGYGKDYLRERARVLRHATHCALCGGVATADDPLTADHVVALRDGGRNPEGNLRPAHRSCNSRRGGQSTSKHR